MSTFISHFSPQRSKPEDLEKILVQREALLSACVSKIRESVLTANKHHLLLVGPRGAGKTNMVALIQHRLQHQTDLADNLRFAWLNEDETSSSFLKLLLRIYRALAARYPTEFTLSLATEILGKSADEALATLERAFLKDLGARTCVVLVENLDALFDTMPEAELRRWRAFLQNHPVTATVGTAQRLFDGVSDRDHTFFGFFDTQHLKPLSSEDARELLKKLALLGNSDSKQADLLAYLDSPKGHARLSAIHHLTGGNPRLYLILADFLTRDTLDALVPAFEKMADQQLTPYYQERLRWLSPQQREIVEYLCQSQHPIVPVKTIAEALFAEHSSIAGQLKKLKEMGYVASRPRGREVYYELAEPLMRLSFQVKEAAASGKQGPAPLRLIVDMLRIWFEQKQLEQTLAELNPGDTSRYYFELALAENLSTGVNLYIIILRHSLADLNKESCTDEEFKNLETLSEETHAEGDLTKYAEICDHRKLYTKAISARTKIITSPTVTAKNKALALMRRGISHVRANMINEAIADYTEIISLKEIPDSFIHNSLVIRNLWYSIAQKPAEALEDLSNAFSKFDESNKWNLVLEQADTISHSAIKSLFAIRLAPNFEYRVNELVTNWNSIGILTHLGAALIRHSASLDHNIISARILNDWYQIWEDVGSKHDELQIPLRLLKTCISYLQSQDEGVLLQLPQEERSLLHDILKTESKI